MPELPEVHTTVMGLKKTVLNKTIKDIWSDFHINTAHKDRETIKNKKYYENFKKIVVGSTIIGTERRGKNILIHLDNNHTIIIHMKMTGHLMYGRYRQNIKSQKTNQKDKWGAVEKGFLQDPYNRFIHFVTTLNNNHHLVFSDMRKFGSICIEKSDSLDKHVRLQKLGQDALQIKLGGFIKKVEENKKNVPIKSLLLDQSFIAGIGNIYSDEVLWEAGVHPLSKPNKIPTKKLKDVFGIMNKILKFSISKGGDSKSDYRNVFGQKGGFQNFHKIYGRKKEKCLKNKCSGIIERIVVKGRSSHFCPKHQILY